MTDEIVSTKDAVASTSLLAVGVGFLMTGVGLLTSGKLYEGLAVAAIGFGVLLFKYKTGY